MTETRGLTFSVFMFLFCLTSLAKAGFFDNLANEVKKGLDGVIDSGSGQSAEPDERGARTYDADRSNHTGQPVAETPSPRKTTSYDRSLVRSIQTRLNELGFNAGTPDGLYGPGTAGAIKAYQRSRGLSADGVPTNELLGRMNSEQRSQAASTNSPPQPTTAAAAGGSILRPLNLRIVNGMPAFYGIGFKNYNQGDFRRFIELLAISQESELIDMPSDERGKEYWCSAMKDFAQRHLTEAARLPYFTSTYRPTGGVCGGYWRGKDEFEQRRSVQDFVARIIPQIQAKAKKLKFPQKVAVVNSSTLQSYDFKKKSYYVVLREAAPSFMTGAHPLGLDPYVVPGYKSAFELKMAPDAAEELRKRLTASTVNPSWRRSGAAGLRWVVEVNLLGMREMTFKAGTRYQKNQDRILGRVDAVRMYAESDKDFTSPVLTLDRNLYFDEQEYAKVSGSGERHRQEEERLANLERVELADQATVAGLYAHASGNGEAEADAMLKEASFSNDTFENQRKAEEARPLLIDSMAKAARNDSVWFQGVVELKPYDVERGVFPVARIRLTTPRSDTPLDRVKVSARATGIDTIAPPLDIARRIEKARGSNAKQRYAVRILATPESTQRERSGYRTLSLRVERIELVDGAYHNTDVSIVDPSKVVWVLDEQTIAANEKARVRREDEAQTRANREQKSKQEFVDRLSACQDKPAEDQEECVARVCADKPSLRDEDEQFMINHECRNAKKSAHLAARLAEQQQAREKEKNASALREDEIRCEGRYLTQGLVKGSAEMQDAVAKCAAAQPREPYGPSILDIQLGMTGNEIQRVATRALGGSGIKHLRAEEKEPFTYGHLYHSKDANHGIAVFLGDNGTDFRVAAVGRRQFFADGPPTVEQAITAMRGSYGKESWREGNTLMWSTSGDPGTCANARMLVVERDGWSRPWRAPGGSRHDPGRKPMMVKVDSAPGDYADFAECGPLLFAYLNSKTGHITDLSLVLFDPAWIAELPEFRFKAAKAGGLQF